AAQSIVAKNALPVSLYGIEKDSYLAALARARIAILGKKANIICANALSFECEDKETRLSDWLEAFDVVLTNPPFGKNITSVSVETLGSFDLGRKWRRGPGHRLEVTPEVVTKASPQVLFMERVLSLLRPGGRAGMIVPESLVSSRSYAHVVQYIRDRANVNVVVGMPEALFKSSGKGGTHTKTCLLV